MSLRAQQVPLAQAALQLGLSYHQVRDRVLRGRLPGGRNEFGHYYVDATELQRLLKKGGKLRGSPTTAARRRAAKTS